MSRPQYTYAPTHTHLARAKACLGTYSPTKFTVHVDDDHDRWRYRIAYSTIWGPGLDMPTFFILCAEYFIKNHRGLKEVRRTIRQVEREKRKKKRQEKIEEDKARKAQKERWVRT
jgi:hypothetical protein